jgi:benzoyl-CoA reductase/2-hydroxyglutaryl-CoA dehydratase subunit BcrC/BadD/HgdB
MANEQQLIRKLNSTARLREIMDGYFVRLKQAAESGNKKIAWCTSVGPEELLYAMGFEVYCPENHAAMLGAAKTAEQYIPVAVAHGYSPDICSYLTSDIGAFLKQETPLKKYGLAAPPRPDVLVYNTNQCADVQHWFAFYARHFNVPLVGIHTPLRVNELSPHTIAYIAREMEALVPQLEQIAGSKFDMDRFKETVKISRAACVLWRQVLETAQHRPSPLNFFDASIHMGPVVVMRGTSCAVDYYKLLLQELQERLHANVGAIPREKYRLYWEGMPLWFKLSALAQLFAKLDASVVASTYCNSWVFDDLDADDPFVSSALAYTKLFIARSDEVKEKVLAELLEKYAVDGMVYHEAKTCPRNSNNHYGLPQHIQHKTGIPYVEIQGDLNDARCFSEEQSIIAIETFIKQLETRNQL